jgi:prepilin peptidase CpaA
MNTPLAQNDNRLLQVLQGHRRTFAFAVAVACTIVWPAVWRPLLGEHLLTTFGGAVLVLLLAACTYTDLTRKRIPNWATYTAVLSALALNATASILTGTADLTGLSNLNTSYSAIGAIGIVPSASGALACFGAMLVIYAVSGSGAGDVKLATAIGAFVGVESGLAAIVWCHLLAGIVVLAWLACKIGPVTSIKVLLRHVGSLLMPTLILPPTVQSARVLAKPIPLAAFFAAGALLALCGVTF